MYKDILTTESATFKNVGRTNYHSTFIMINVANSDTYGFYHSYISNLTEITTKGVSLERQVF